MAQAAHIAGKVEYREGDGPTLPIRPGPIDVTATHNDVTIGWSDGDTSGSTAMPLADFKRYVAEGAIRMESPLVVPVAPAAPVVDEPPATQAEPETAR